MSPLFDLSGRVALVTGGTAGIGLAMAEGLRDAGAEVVLAGRNPERGEAAVRALGTAAHFVAGDVAQAADCAEMVEAAAAWRGRLDILINNAGTAIRKLPQDLTAADWATVIDTNLTGTWRCSQAAYPHLRQAGAGKIVMIGSLMSFMAAPHAAAYAASKGGVVQLARALATAWAADNIQVNAVLPGWIDTELTVGARAQVAGLAESVVARAPVGRWGKPADLAGVAVFLSASASDFITGAAIVADGGYGIRA